jgi:hypothetical protein
LAEAGLWVATLMALNAAIASAMAVSLVVGLIIVVS